MNFNQTPTRIGMAAKFTRTYSSSLCRSPTRCASLSQFSEALFFFVIYVPPADPQRGCIVRRCGDRPRFFLYSSLRSCLRRVSLVYLLGSSWNCPHV